MSVSHGAGGITTARGGQRPLPSTWPETATSRTCSTCRFARSYLIPSSTCQIATTPGAVQPADPGGISAFITKTSAAGDVVYRTFLGGSGADFPTGLAVDTNGNAYVTGYTTSADFPVKNALQATIKGGNEGFVAKLNATGTAISYASFIGGSGDDQANAIAVDALGAAHVVGETRSSDFPLLNAFQKTLAGVPDAFVSKLNPDGTLRYVSYLGGRGADVARAVAIDSTGASVVVGETQADGFPLVKPFQPTYREFHDGFVASIADPWQPFFAVDPLETPLVGDFNGDGRTDIITFTRQNPLRGRRRLRGAVGRARASSARRRQPTSGTTGSRSRRDETVVIGDYDGDGKDDIATWLGEDDAPGLRGALAAAPGMAPETVWAGQHRLRPDRRAAAPAT